MTCPSLARPADYSLANNMAIAQAYAATHGVAEKYSWFHDMAKGKGPWDYKRLDRAYEDLCNWNNGAVGTARAGC